MTFKTWAINKNVKETDLVFMRTLTSAQLDLFYRAADQVALLGATFTEGLEIFEILADLILSGKIETLCSHTDTLTDYREHLRSLRYPIAFKRDQELKKKFESLPWPYGSKIKFERRGDRAGVEIKLFISSEVELTKILASFERVQKEISK